VRELPPRDSKEVPVSRIENQDENEVNPTVRWLVHGAWKIALAVVVVLLVAGILSALLR
jgi:hypothetical protein